MILTQTPDNFYSISNKIFLHTRNASKKNDLQKLFTTIHLLKILYRSYW